ncbi:MAG: ribbon-helix-helix protein, CopG family, partial [bacterium]|nr:ribbon-helix-helix protein, CopG family [bacterium]
TKLSVAELRELCRNEVGRESSSIDAAYLRWRIGQARKGKIPVGPRRTKANPDAEYKHVPLRLEASVVESLDEARERLGLKSRSELVRRSLHAFLLEAGEVRVAEMVGG